MPIRIALLILSIAAMIGCARPLGLAIPTGEPLQLEIYSRGSLNQKCAITSSSAQFQQLEKLLAANPDDWEPTPVTYAPSVLVTGNGFSINFLHDFAVVNHSDGQFKHPMPKSAYVFLRCPDGT